MAPQQLLSMIRKDADSPLVPTKLVVGSCPSALTSKDVERDRGRPLNRYERNMIIFNWLQTLEGENYEAVN